MSRQAVERTILYFLCKDTFPAAFNCLSGLCSLYQGCNHQKKFVNKSIDLRVFEFSDKFVFFFCYKTGRTNCFWKIALIRDYIYPDDFYPKPSQITIVIDLYI